MQAPTDKQMTSSINYKEVQLLSVFIQISQIPTHCYKSLLDACRRMIDSSKEKTKDNRIFSLPGGMRTTSFHDTSSICVSQAGNVWVVVDPNWQERASGAMTQPQNTQHTLYNVTLPCSLIPNISRSASPLSHPAVCHRELTPHTHCSHDLMCNRSDHQTRLSSSEIAD